MSGSTRIGVGVSDDLVVVRHHGSVHRDDMSGRVCVSERRQCESRLGGSTTPWECEWEHKDWCGCE